MSTANGDATVEIGGKKYAIRLTPSRVGEAELHMQRSALDIVVDLQRRRMGVREIQALFFASCTGQHSVYTFEGAGDVLDEAKGTELVELGAALAWALIAMLGYDAEEKDAKKKALSDS